MYAVSMTKYWSVDEGYMLMPLMTLHVYNYKEVPVSVS